MVRIARCALALCVLCGPAADAPAAELVARLEWPGGLAVRCEIPVGAADLLLQGEAGPDVPPSFAAGLDAPFVRVGRLAPTGLLRLSMAPLDFGPGSDVLGEATGLRLDRSMSADGETSVALIVAPERLALFRLRADGEPGALLGCAAGAGRGGAVAMDGVVAVRENRPEGTPEDAWFAACAPMPAGRALNAAARFALRLPLLTATVSGGMSAAERAPPGWFALGAATIGRGDSGIDVLAAGSTRSYLELGGMRRPGGARVGVRLRYASSDARVQVRYVMSVGCPGYLSGPFLPSEEDIALTLARRWPARGSGAWEADLALANRIEIDVDGATIDDPSGSLSAGWSSARFQARVRVDVDRDDGATIGMAASAIEPDGRWRAGAEASCSLGGTSAASLSAAGRIQWSGTRGELLLRTGVRNLPAGRGGLHGAAPWASFEWRASDRAEGG